MAKECAIQTTTPRGNEVTRRTRPSAWTYRPDIDIVDAGEEIVLFADVPGADADGIDVSLESGILTVDTRVQPRNRAQAQTIMREYGVGNYHRRFEIDETIDPEGVNAEYRDGVLAVHLPKARCAQRRRIPVSS